MNVNKLVAIGCICAATYLVGYSGVRMAMNRKAKDIVVTAHCICMNLFALGLCVIAAFVSNGAS
jgi:hypothetical protein